MDAPHSQRPLSRWWLLAFLVTFALGGLWALASPTFSGPDEPAHVLRSVSLVHGTLLGTPKGGRVSPTTQVRVPAWLSGANSAPRCFAGKVSVSAQCEPPLPTAAGSVTTTTYAGRYPPLYYAIVGWPSLVTSGELALYLMRLASAAASAVFLAGALFCASRSRHARGLLVGLALVMTPQVFFLGGVVNPSGLEISSAICVWTAALVACEAIAAPGELRRSPANLLGWLTHGESRRAFRLPGSGPPASVLGWLTAAGAVMVSIRGLSPFLCLVMGLSVAAYAGRGRVVALLRDRRAQAGLSVIVGFGVLATAWILTAGALAVRPSGTQLPTGASGWLVLGLTLENLGPETLQMVGVFGWVDSYLPVVCYVVWLGLATLFLGGGIASKLTRRRIALVGYALVTIAVPTIVLVARSDSLGIFGQARDWMPLWVGLPLLVGHALSTGATAEADIAPPGHRWSAAAQRYLIWAVLACLPILQVFAWAWALRRYRTGSGSVALISRAAWSPPVPAHVLLAAVVICSVLLSWCYVRCAADRVNTKRW